MKVVFMFQLKENSLTHSARPKAMYLMDATHFNHVYGPKEQAELNELVDISTSLQTRESLRQDCSVLRDIELIFSGWGGVRLDQDILTHAPQLKAVFYAAGSVRSIVTEAFWRRGIRITTAATANAIPVAEFTLGAILLSLKHVWHHLTHVRREGSFRPTGIEPGGDGSTVGIIALGEIGRLVCRKLQDFDVHLLVADPLATITDAQSYGAELVELDTLFTRSDVVSLHAPWLPETQGLITGDHLARMKPGATFINTARGAIVCETQMIRVLQQRPDLQAVLDVTHPEPPHPDSPLYTLPNVVLTPHLAGSLPREQSRMGRLMIEEVRRYLAGQPMLYELNHHQAAHRA